MKPNIYRCGDRALTIEFEREISPAVNCKVLALDRFLCNAGIRGITETVPSYASLLVCYEPDVVSFESLCATLRSALDKLSETNTPEAKIWTVPCCYGMHFGKDLDNVCRHSGLTEKEVISIHSSTEYRIYMLGFLPGFVYLGGMDERLATPRLKKPRIEIPRGSVGIGGKQTGIYPLVSPGGWNLIGCTPIDLYIPNSREPVLFSAGDFIRFKPVSADEFYLIRHDVMRGKYTPGYYLRGEK